MLRKITNRSRELAAGITSVAVIGWMLANPKTSTQMLNALGKTYTDAVSALIPPATTETTTASDGTPSESDSAHAEG